MESTPPESPTAIFMLQNIEKPKFFKKLSNFPYMDIAYWRKKIDELENNLIELLNNRANYAVKIGKIKKEKGLPVFDASREQEILERVAAKAKACDGPLSPESMARIFQVIMTETRQVER